MIEIKHQPSNTETNFTTRLTALMAEIRRLNGKLARELATQIKAGRYSKVDNGITVLMTQSPLSNLVQDINDANFGISASCEAYTLTLIFDIQTT